MIHCNRRLYANRCPKLSTSSIHPIEAIFFKAYAFHWYIIFFECQSTPISWLTTELVYSCESLTSLHVGEVSAIITSPYNDGSTTNSALTQIATVLTAPVITFTSSTKIAHGAPKVNTK